MLVLPKSKTVTVDIVINGEKQKLELDTVNAEMAPNLTTPTLVDLIANTSAVDTSKIADVEYRALAKSEPTVVYKNGELIQNQSAVSEKTLEISVARLSPVEIIDKYKLNDIDINSKQGLEEYLAKQIINFTDSIRHSNDIIALNNLAYCAQEFQKKIALENSQYTTFLKGAHVEKKNLTTADQIYDSISQAKTVMQNIGKANAKTLLDQNVKFARGIPMDDVVLIIREEIMDKLLSKQGLYSSDSGLELFKNMNITKVLGIPTIRSSNLPNGVNWIMTTIGKLGTVAFAKLGIGDWYQLSEDPDWSLNKRLHCARQQVLGILYETLIIASFDADTTIEWMDNYYSIAGSLKTTMATETFEIKNQEMEKSKKSNSQKVKDKFSKKDNEEEQNIDEQISEEQINE